MVMDSFSIRDLLGVVLCLLAHFYILLFFIHLHVHVMCKFNRHMLFCGFSQCYF